MSNNPFDELNHRFDCLEKMISELKEVKSTGNSIDEERLISPNEACKLFVPQISKQTLHSWSEQGLIPRHRLGGRIFYKRSEVLASLQTLKKYSRQS